MTLMTLKQKIDGDLKDAMRNKEELRLSTLRMLSASIKNREIEKRAKLSKNPDTKDLEKESMLTDDEVVEAVRSEAKKRRDAIEGFEKGGRIDLAGKEKKEQEILQHYLPQELSEDDLGKIVDDVVIEFGVGGMKDYVVNDFTE